MSTTKSFPNHRPDETAHATSNKAIVRRFHDAANTGDGELLSKTIDEIVEPDAQIRTPLPFSQGAGLGSA